MTGTSVPRPKFWIRTDEAPMSAPEPQRVSPATMKSNNSLIDGFLNPSDYAAYATYLNDFARYMADSGAPLYAMSVQNEPDIDVTYESCDWTPAQMLDFCQNYAQAITATRPPGRRTLYISA